jgi:hypothetical protein
MYEKGDPVAFVMNERIKELMDQARDETPKGISFDTGLSSYSKRFAELIIKQCVKSLWTEECHNSDLALEEFERNSAKIREHFGVEE